MRSLTIASIVLAAAACRGVDGELESDPSADPEEFGRADGSSDGSSQMSGGAADTEFAAAGVSDDSTPGGLSGTVGQSPSDVACRAPMAGVSEILDGRVRTGSRVEVSELLVTTRKFLLYRGKTNGACLWGQYTAAAADSEATAGLLLVAYGEPAADETLPCPLETDPLGDSLPGDVLTATGEVVAHVPSTCAHVRPSIQLRLGASCPSVRTGSMPGLSPHPLELGTASALASGSLVEIKRFAGGVISLQDISARAVPGQSDAVGPYGVIALNESELLVHDSIAFMDVTAGGPGAAGKAFQFGYPTSFASISGILHLDYCTWVIAPRDACSDFVPQSLGCP